jgi:hypothetical protein
MAKALGEAEQAARQIEADRIMSKLRPRRRNHHCCKRQLRLHSLRNFRNLRSFRNLASVESSGQVVSRDDVLRRFRGQRHRKSTN